MRSVCRDALVVMEYVLTQTFTFAAELHVVNHSVGLHYALSHHGVGNLHEACHVGTLDVVDVAVRLCAILDSLLVNGVHDVVELLVHLSLAPVQTH